MSDMDRLAEMQPDVLKLLRTAVEDNLYDLKRAAAEGRISSVAWLTRNLLELAIWTSYCANSEVNAKQFVLDSARDLHDALDLPEGLFSEDYNFRAARAEAIQEAKEQGFETLDENYTAVSKVAKALGKGEDFKYANKLLSKYAHPTALSVICQDGESIQMLKGNFYMLGMNLADQILRLIDQRLQ